MSRREEDDDCDKILFHRADKELDQILWHQLRCGHQSRFEMIIKCCSLVINEPKTSGNHYPMMISIGFGTGWRFFKNKRNRKWEKKKKSKEKKMKIKTKDNEEIANAEVPRRQINIQHSTTTTTTTATTATAATTFLFFFFFFFSGRRFLSFRDTRMVIPFGFRQ